MKQIQELEPTAIWKNFALLNSVPRPSHKEARVIQFIKDFAQKNGLNAVTDSVGNVLVQKAASKGKEDAPTVILQSHLDMVHQKNKDTEFDFSTQGICMYEENGWVKAKGTTLGADNGIGVAAAMTILQAKYLIHPPLECLFTVNEEDGMTGASCLKNDFLKGSILINMDSERDDELTIGCAGGLVSDITGSYPIEDIRPNSVKYEVSLTGLTGGHSGVDIHRNRGNSIQILAEIFSCLAQELTIQIHSFEGGGLNNAIPREAKIKLAIPRNACESFEELFLKFQSQVKRKYHYTDPSLNMTIRKTEFEGEAMNEQFQSRFLTTVASCPNGVYKMHTEMSYLVGLSNNLGIAEVSDGKFHFVYLSRGFSESEIQDMYILIESHFERLGGHINTLEGYPSWSPNLDSKILKKAKFIYKQLFDELPTVQTIHAGLECAIFAKTYPELDMISFGPSIYQPHSPDETVKVVSVQKFWKYLIALLENIND